MERAEDLLTTEDALALIGIHYQLHCYVCGRACTKPSPFDGWATFTQIMQQRPDGCRFAVARIVPVFGTKPQGPYLVWDLFLPRAVHNNGWINAPKPLWRSASVDGLVMKAMALYDRE